MQKTETSSHYDCNIKGSSAFVARFQSKKQAADFQKRNDNIDTTKVSKKIQAEYNKRANYA